MKTRTTMLALLGAAALLAGAAPLKARTLAYAGIGGTVASFDAAHPEAPAIPPAGITSYRVTSTRKGRVSSYQVVAGASSNLSTRGLLALVSGAAQLPADAKPVRRYNGKCAVHRSAWLGRVIGLRYIILYASRGDQTAGAWASLAPYCRG